jgi:hypothetical protein
MNLYFNNLKNFQTGSIPKQKNYVDIFNYTNNYNVGNILLSFKNNKFYVDNNNIFLKLDGTTYSRYNYPDLFYYINSNNFATLSGDSFNTFLLPDAGSLNGNVYSFINAGLSCIVNYSNTVDYNDTVSNNIQDGNPGCIFISLSSLSAERICKSVKLYNLQSYLPLDYNSSLGLYTSTNFNLSDYFIDYENYSMFNNEKEIRIFVNGGYSTGFEQSSAFAFNQKLLVQLDMTSYGLSVLNLKNVYAMLPLLTYSNATETLTSNSTKIPQSFLNTGTPTSSSFSYIPLLLKRSISSVYIELNTAISINQYIPISLVYEI